jgi:Asp-tRNA(Asn)/Glu-tRNA(Gln) amidotransferase A subunit family amidase
MLELNFLSAVSLAAQVRTKRLSPVELIEAYLDRIEALNPRLNAFVQVDAEGARRQARLAEVAVSQGRNLGPLHGIPLSIKSSVAVAGLRCEAGTKLRAGVVATEDAALVSRLRQAGAIILGVTNAPELLMAWETDNLLYGRTNNPWDLSRTPGGSSGGEAAAIASGMSAGGVGSDGGGSIRVPAHFSGICGLKPTPGRVPATGHFPVSAGPFALLGVVGPMARTAQDLKVLFEVMQGPDDGDPSAAPVPLRWPEEQDLKRIRIGYFEDDGRTPVTPETRAAVRAAAEALQYAGFQVEPFRPEGLEPVRQLWWKLFGIAGGMLLGPMTRGHDAELSPILKEYSAWVASEPAHSGESLLDTWLQRDLVRMQIFAQMREYPVLLCPVAAIPAFRHGERRWQIGGKTVQYLDAWSYTEWFNLLGTPAAVVPVGSSPEGLPIGVQFAARPWEEELVLAVAAALESQMGGWRQPPEL